jgi:hypothetical protein
MMASNPLIGTWRLISWENRSLLDGQVSYPLGKDATGYIMYNDDRYMFVAIMGSNRLKFATEDLLSAIIEEGAQAEETYVSYCGRHKFHEETVVHHVELSLFPNWVGGKQARLVEVTGGRPTEIPPHLGACLKVRAVRSLFTEGPSTMDFSEVREGCSPKNSPKIGHRVDVLAPLRPVR